jgi:predicted dehydrogenase
MKFGLVGTGYWARKTHAPALASSGDAELTAIWGRNGPAARELASEYEAAAVDDIGELLAAVDAVAFAVPPDVQCPIAIRAATAGKHLLLDKPVATSPTWADALVSAADKTGIASVVFFTARFQENVRDWLLDVAAGGGWAGGAAVWLGTALQDGNPYNTPWRREKGALWDLGPHVVSLLWASLGPVEAVTAQPGQADITHLELRHRGGATSTATLTLSAKESAAYSDLFVWGEAGRRVAPLETHEPVAALRTAIAELTANAESGKTAHPCDVRFGRDVGRVLAAAEHQLKSAPLAG